jgi:hypothetical protein
VTLAAGIVAALVWHHWLAVFLLGLALMVETSIVVAYVMQIWRGELRWQKYAAEQEMLRRWQARWEARRAGVEQSAQTRERRAA